MTHPVEAWHEVVATRDMAALDALFADDVVFHSPVVHTPQRGKAVTGMYLGAALSVLGNDSFAYVRDVRGDHDAVLEFETTIDDTFVNGVDLISFDEDGHIDDFKVMLRPLQAVSLVHELMATMLERAAGRG